MKINLINMILYHAGTAPFECVVIEDDGRELDAAAALDALIMEYAKVRNGGQSSMVELPARYRDASQPTNGGE